MSDYGGRGYRGSASRIRYYHYDPGNSQRFDSPHQRGQPRGHWQPRENQYSYHSEPRNTDPRSRYPHSSHLITSPTPSNITFNQPDYEPVKPGPNATRKPPTSSSPSRRLRQATVSAAASGVATTSTGMGEASHEAELAKRKAFDAKRFRGHGDETEGGNIHVIFSDTEKQESDVEQPGDDEELAGEIQPPMAAAAEKTRQHIAANEKELLKVNSKITRLQAQREELNAEITRLQAEREILTRQRCSYTDILSSIVANSAASQGAAKQRSKRTVSPKKPSQKAGARKQLQCPEVSTHSHVPVSPVTVVEDRERPAKRARSTIQSSKRGSEAANVAPSRPEPVERQNSGSPSEPPPLASGTLHLVFRDIDSGYSDRGPDDDSLIVTSFVTVVNDPDILLFGNKSGHVCKYSLQNQQVLRKEFIFRKSVTALCGIVDGADSDLRIFVGSSDGDYRCYNGNLSEVISSNRFGWGVCCIKYLLSHVYIGIGVSLSLYSKTKALKNGLVSLVCPTRGVVLERFSAGCSFIHDIEALQESARDTIVCSLKSSDNLSVRDAADGLALRSIELPGWPSFFDEPATSAGTTALKQVNSAASPLACTHLACAGGFIFGCQANGQVLAVAPGDRKAVVVANLDSRPIELTVMGLNSSAGIHVAVVTADAIIRVFTVSSSNPIGYSSKKKKRTTSAFSKRQRRMSSSSEDEQSEPASSLSFHQVFHATMAAKDWSVRAAVVTASGLICIVSYRTNSSNSNAICPPWVLEVFTLPKMLIGEVR